MEYDGIRDSIVPPSFYPGFPSAEALFCPVFTQNKGVYLNAMIDSITPTF
jgi:hypothetical protein